jgi:serine kinase of HPr protein (carbohydrate metabolism regulator)
MMRAFRGALTGPRHHATFHPCPEERSAPLPLIHASVVAIGGQGVLIRGGSGAGKSDLALRLIDAGAVLVADDYCEAEALDGRLVTRPPPAISGKLEVRGFGIVEMPHLPSATIGLIVDLVPEADIERLPDPHTDGTDVIDGVRIPRLRLDPTRASAPAKVRLALRTPPQGMA